MFARPAVATWTRKEMTRCLHDIMARPAPHQPGGTYSNPELAAGVWNTGTGPSPLSLTVSGSLARSQPLHDLSCTLRTSGLPSQGGRGVAVRGRKRKRMRGPGCLCVQSPGRRENTAEGRILPGNREIDHRRQRDAQYNAGRPGDGASRPPRTPVGDGGKFLRTLSLQAALQTTLNGSHTCPQLHGHRPDAPPSDPKRLRAPHLPTSDRATLSSPRAPPPHLPPQYAVARGGTSSPRPGNRKRLFFRRKESGAAKVVRPGRVGFVAWGEAALCSVGGAGDTSVLAGWLAYRASGDAAGSGSRGEGPVIDLCSSQ